MPGARCRDLHGENHQPSQTSGNDPTIANGERAHAHKKQGESTRQFQLKFYPHQLKNLPTERWKNFLGVSIRVWTVFCYIHHLEALYTPRSQSARLSSRYSRNKESLPQEPAIWFKTGYIKKKKDVLTNRQMDWGRKNKRDMWLPTIGRLLSFSFFFFF